LFKLVDIPRVGIANIKEGREVIMKEVRNAIPYVTLSEADIYGKGSHKKMLPHA
jgi:hypothetical protein